QGKSYAHTFVTPFLMERSDRYLAESRISTFYPFQLRNWTPHAMLYLKGTSKLRSQTAFEIDLETRVKHYRTLIMISFEIDVETPVKHYRTLILICLNIRRTTMGQIAMTSIINKNRKRIKIWKAFNRNEKKKKSSNFNQYRTEVSIKASRYLVPKCA
uniref:Uncharacterized protein n=1 Tax=Gadus morhua TaxID=8049 RepID=A0A8C5BYW0_GADMO